MTLTATSATANAAAKAFAARFTRAMTGAAAGALSTVVEDHDDALADTDAAARSIGNVTLTVDLTALVGAGLPAVRADQAGRAANLPICDPPTSGCACIPRRYASPVGTMAAVSTIRMTARSGARVRCTIPLGTT